MNSRVIITCLFMLFAVHADGQDGSFNCCYGRYVRTDLRGMINQDTLSEELYLYPDSFRTVIVTNSNGCRQEHNTSGTWYMDKKSHVILSSGKTERGWYSRYTAPKRRHPRKEGVILVFGYQHFTPPESVIKYFMEH